MNIIEQARDYAQFDNQTPYEIILARELAFIEGAKRMEKKAVFAYCFECNGEYNCCPYEFPSICEKRERFINKLNS